MPPVADTMPGTRRPASVTIADRVKEQLHRDYPPNALSWVGDLTWSGPTSVPAGQIDQKTGDTEWSAAASDKAKLQTFRKRIAAGWRKPVVLVRTPGGGKLFAVDGHTRILSCTALGVPVTAYIGTAKTATGEWRKTHSRQLAGDGGAIELVGPKGFIHGWIKVGAPADSLAAHTDQDGKLTAARSALHEKIVRDTLAGHAKSARPVARFMGGGPASGKSTVMKGVDPGVLIDSDGIKAKLPEYRQMTKAGNPAAAAYAHEESSALAKQIMARAAKSGMDFTLDGTGDSGYDKMAKKVAEARSSGHKVHGAYVTVDTDEAVRRANKRAARTGRVVPEPVIREIHSSVTKTFSDAVARDLFDSAELWDNNGPEPVLVGSKPEGGSWTVHNRPAWERFLAKG